MPVLTHLLCRVFIRFKVNIKHETNVFKTDMLSKLHNSRNA